MIVSMIPRPIKAAVASVATLLLFSLLLTCYRSVFKEERLPPIVDGLSWTFYQSSCPGVETIIRNHLRKVFKEDIRRAAGLLRLHFHDCFVLGCEGSILLNGPDGKPSTEQDAPPNQSLSKMAFKIVEDLRRLVHNKCGIVVSCTDILALAARDSVFLSGGPDYKIPLGRRDGLTFATTQVTIHDLPSPHGNTTATIKSFAAKNLSITDVVALSGAHTIGDSHCDSFTDRLYPYQDWTMDKPFADHLRKICPTLHSNNTSVMDIRSPRTLDNKYYVDLRKRQGLFTSDQDLYTDSRTYKMVTEFSNNHYSFFENFVVSMIKMGQVGVLTTGEIRAHCNETNSNAEYLKTVMEEIHDEL